MARKQLKMAVKPANACAARPSKLHQCAVVSPRLQLWQGLSVEF
jgi:hypothetical protein